MTRWDGKFVFIATRAILAGFGVIKTLIVVRLLDLEDYALIGVVESVRNLISILLGLGVGDSISREGAVAPDNKSFARLLIAGLLSATVLNLLVAGVLYTLSIFSSYFYADPQIAALLLIAIPVSIAERYWLLLLSAVRILNGHKWFLLYSLVFGIAGMLVTIVQTYLNGVVGYFNSQWIVSVVLVIAVFVQMAFCLRRSINVDMLKDLASAFRALWDVSVFMYFFKSSAVIWRRGPFLMGAQFLSADVLGIVSVAMELASKLQILQQSLSPLIVPKLSKLYVHSRIEYIRAAKEEMLEVLSITVLTGLCSVWVWSYWGDLIVGRERWLSIGDGFIFATVVEFSFSLVNLFNMCVLMPTKRFGGLLSRTIVLRVMSLPMFYVFCLLWPDKPDAIFLSMLVSGFIAALVYCVSAVRVLNNLSA